MARRRRTKRHDRLMEKVWVALGSHRIEERWIDDRHGWFGFQEPGKLVISPANLLPTLLHEAIHACMPQATERGVQRLTTSLWQALSDADAKRMWQVYNARVIRMKSSVSSTNPKE